MEQVGNHCDEKYFKFVGHVLDDKLSWQGHVQHICKKLASANFVVFVWLEGLALWMQMGRS